VVCPFVPLTPLEAAILSVVHKEEERMEGEN